jgi:hypothetical protein
MRMVTEFDNELELSNEEIQEGIIEYYADEYNIKVVHDDKNRTLEYVGDEKSFEKLWNDYEGEKQYMFDILIKFEK